MADPEIELRFVAFSNAVRDVISKAGREWKARIREENRAAPRAPRRVGTKSSREALGRHSLPGEGAR